VDPETYPLDPETFGFTDPADFHYCPSHGVELDPRWCLNCFLIRLFHSQGKGVDLLCLDHIETPPDL